MSCRSFARCILLPAKPRPLVRRSLFVCVTVRNNRAMTANNNCIFCNIAAGTDGKTNVLYQDETFVVFPDIRPAATHHYLVCPREHIQSAKELTKEHLPLVENMIAIGKQVLAEHNGDVDRVRFGFHWPPFCSVHHLHLHVISPESEMRMLPWLFGIFSPRTPWFRSVDWVIERLKALPA